MAEINFGGVVEEVITSEEFSLQKAREILSDEIVAVLGYGVQGPGQSLNLRDNGINVIVGQRPNSKSWDRAVDDGFVPGKTLFGIEDAARKATVVQFLLSDAGQVATWPQIKECLNPGDALYFSHGFGIVYKDQTKVIPPEDVDVILVAPKGSGRNVRLNFLDGSGINSSFAVHQDTTGKAEERTIALGIAIGAGYLLLRKSFGFRVPERGVEFTDVLIMNWPNPRIVADEVLAIAPVEDVAVVAIAAFEEIGAHATGDKIAAPAT